jgi:hypothetical protein
VSSLRSTSEHTLFAIAKEPKRLRQSMRYNAHQTGLLRILLQDPRRVRFTFGVNF